MVSTREIGTPIHYYNKGRMDLKINANQPDHPL